MVAIADYERELVGRLVDGLEEIKGVRSTASPIGRGSGRACPTVAVSIAGVAPAGGRGGARPRGIFAWDGDFYATGPDRAARQGRDRRCPAARARPLQHGRRGRPALEAIARIAAGPPT